MAVLSILAVLHLCIISVIKSVNGSISSDIKFSHLSSYNGTFLINEATAVVFKLTALKLITHASWPMFVAHFFGNEV